MQQLPVLSNTDVTLNRNKFIGGSEIAKIMGLSRWGTPLSVWAEKTGKIPAPDLSDNEAVRMGTRLEQFVADLFTEETGKTVRRAPKVYRHSKYPYMVAHIDRIVTGTDELLECKTASTFKKEEWEGEEIPQEYILQVMWYLGITGRKIGHIAVLIGGQHFKTKTIEYDEELFNNMVEAAKDFWENYVLTDTPPKVGASDETVLAEMFSDANSFIIELYPVDEKSEIATTDFETKVAYLKELEAQYKNIEAEIKQHKNDIRMIIGDNLGIKTPKYVITNKTQRQSRVDVRALCENEPNVYAKYERVSTFKVLRITKNKESEVA